MVNLRERQIMTIAPALQQFVAQVKNLRPDAKVQYGEPDGIGFVREVSFDAQTGKVLKPILEVGIDPRIARFKIGGRERRMTVTVVSDTRADYRDPFPIEDVAEVLKEK
jgi:hypothetical protein